MRLGAALGSGTDGVEIGTTECRGFDAWSGPGAEECVEDAVSPCSGPEMDCSQDTFAFEADLLQCSLLRDIVDFGKGLESVCWGGLEQVVDEQPLGGRSYSAATELGQQRDPDLVDGSLRDALSPVGVVDIACERSGAVDCQPPVGWAQPAVFLPAASPLLRVHEAGPLELAPGCGVGQVAAEIVQVIFLDRPKDHVFHRAIVWGGAPVDEHADLDLGSSGL